MSHPTWVLGSELRPLQEHSALLITGFVHVYVVCTQAPVEARCISSSGAAVFSVSPIVSTLALIKQNSTRKRSHGWRKCKVRS